MVRPCLNGNTAKAGRPSVWCVRLLYTDIGDEYSELFRGCLFEHAELFADLDECSDGTVKLLAVVSG